MVKVSVVIPVYNVEDYLKEALDGIVNQTLDDIEIICVNDGSTDNSLKILNEYASKDDRFIVIDQENGGHAVATNRGIELAKGDYLYLMDADDIVDVNTLKETVEIAEDKNVDFLIFQANNYYMDTQEYVEQEYYSMNELADFVGDRVFDWRDIKDFIFDISVTPWSKLYNRNFIEKSGAKFPEGLVFDDNIFFWEVLFSAERITFYRKCLFTRRRHSMSSTMHGNMNFLDSIDIFELMWDTFKRFDTFEENKTQLYNKRVGIGYWRFTTTKDEFKPAYFDKFKDSLSKIKDEELFDDFYNGLWPRNRTIYDAVLSSQNYRELMLNVDVFDYKKKIKELKRENKKLKKEVKKLQNSKSWKVKNPLSSIKNKMVK